MDKLDIVKKRLENVDNLPTLPVIAAQLLDLLSDDRTSMGDIAKVISVDPSITGKVLRIANSPFYGIRRNIDTIRLALVVLGINEVRNILLSVSLYKSFSFSSGESAFDREKYWEHSLAVAMFAKILTQKMNIRTHGEEFTAGLMHDIGKIIIDQYFHEESIEIYKIIEEERIPNYEAEERILGVNHMDLGAWLARKWKLPEHLVESIRYHHFPHVAEGDPILASMVHLGNLYASSKGIGQSINYERFDFTSSPAWDQLFLLKEHLESIDLDDLEEQLESEVETVQSYMRLAT